MALEMLVTVCSLLELSVLLLRTIFYEKVEFCGNEK